MRVQAAGDQGAAPIRILLVEDNPGDAMLVRLALAPGAFEFRHCKRMGEAREALRAVGADLVLLDLSLPDSTGWQTIDGVRGVAPGTPIIVLTGFDDPDFAVSAVGGEVQDYLVKGEFDASLLQRAIRYALARSRMEERLRASEERFRLLFNSSHDAIFVHPAEPGGRFIEVNDVACARLGYSRQELQRLCPDDIDDCDGRGERARVAVELADKRSCLYECRHVARDGRRVPVEIQARLFEMDGKPMVISVARDVSERKAAEEKIARMANYDQLTDLPNRNLLAERFAQALASARRYDRLLAALFLDLDGFKPINDLHGHHVGDAVLREVAQRLKQCMRDADTVCRFGGDEFVILAAELGAPQEAVRVAAKLIEAVSAPIDACGRRVQIGGSIGIALFPEHGDTVAELLKKADAAMYRAKAAGRGRLSVAAA